MSSTKPPHTLRSLGTEARDLEEIESGVKSSPETLTVQMEAYLEGIRDHVSSRVFDQRAEQILRASEFFDEQVQFGIGTSKLVMDGSDNPVLKLVDDGSVSEFSQKRFSELVNEYYAELADPYGKLVTNIRNDGPDYLMRGFQGYREEAAMDMEEMLRKLVEAETVSKEKLEPISEYYRVADSWLPVRRSSSPPPPNADLSMGDRDRLRITRSLSDIVEGLSTRADIRKTSMAVMNTTSDLMHHLSDNLGKKGLEVIGEPGKRPLGRLPEGQLEQLETMLAITNTTVRDYEELVTIHRDILGGIGDDERMLLLTKKKSDSTSA